MITSSAFSSLPGKTSARHALFSVSTIFAVFSLAHLPPLSAGEPAPSSKLATPANEVEPIIIVDSSVGIDSSYVSEGIDNVPGAEWLTATIDVSAAGFTFSALYGKTTAENYDELNLGLKYTCEVGKLSIAGGYTYLTYPEPGDPDGHELSFGLEYAAFDWLTFAMVTYYDVAAIEGGFLEMSATGNVPLLADRIALNPYVLLAYDYGYVSGANDTFNNAQVGVDVPISITEQITLILSAHHSWALDNLREEDLGDVSWAGARIVFAF